MTSSARFSILWSSALLLALALAACDDGGGGSGGDGDTDSDADADTDADADADAGTDAGDEFAIDPQRIHDDVAWLADDARMGRESGTPGNAAALAYVADALAAMGAAPAGDDETYYDAFTYPEWRETAPSALAIDGEALVAGFDFDVLRYSPSGGGAEGPLVFAGYGTVVPPYDPAEYPDCPFPAEGYDDYAGLDLAGATVLRFASVPNGDASIVTDCPLEGGSTHAAEAGAVAIVLVHDYAWPSAELDIGITLHADVVYPLPVLNVGRAYAETLVPDLEARYATLSDYLPAAAPTAHTAAVAVTTAVTESTIHNVLAAFPGADPEIGGEVVLVGGHVDHIGAELEGGAIYNGADDNASGVAVAMEIARGVAAIPGGPRRTVLIAAWNAEECGLFGSCAYAASPHYPHADTVAVLNLDAVGAGNGAGAYLISGADPLNSWFAALMNAGIDAAGYDYGVISTLHMDSSDHTCFYAAGVPAVTMQTLGTRTTTHTQYDDIGVINLDDLEAAARLSWAAIRPLAEGTEADYE